MEASGIPELRKFCRAVNAQAQLDESVNFLLNKLPSLLSTASLWVTRLSKEEAGGKVREIQETREELLKEIDLVHKRVSTGHLINHIC